MKEPTRRPPKLSSTLIQDKVQNNIHIASEEMEKKQLWNVLDSDLGATCRLYQVKKRGIALSAKIQTLCPKQGFMCILHNKLF